MAKTGSQGWVNPCSSRVEIQIYTRIWAAKRAIKGCSDIPTQQLHHRGWLSIAQCCSLSRRRRSLCVQFTLVQVHKFHGMRSQALLGFLNPFTALFQGNQEKNSDSRMFLEFCSNLAQSLIPITHRCQVEITLNRNNWPESNPSRKSDVCQKREITFLGSSCCRAVCSGQGCAPRAPEGQTTSSGLAFLSDRQHCP